MCLFCTAGPNAQTALRKGMVQSLSFPPRVSLEGEILKLIYITGKQSEGEKRKNTFICVKEETKQKGCGSRSQQGKPTDPDKHILFHAEQGRSTSQGLRPKRFLKQKQPQAAAEGVTCPPGMTFCGLVCAQNCLAWLPSGCC